MVIRNYETHDRTQVVSLWESVFPNSTGHNDPAAAIDRKIGCDDGLFFVAEADGKIIGTVLGGYDGHRGWIYSLAVATAHRRMKIGTALVHHTEQALTSRGCPKVNLQVRTDNAEVVSFYESLGFCKEARISMGKLID